MPLSILHCDEWLIALDKPAGLLSEPGLGPDKQDCLLARVREIHPTARIVHRLDRDTTGVIVLALDADTHRELSRQFQAREVEKRYLSLVDGCLPQDSGRIDLPLGRDFAHPPRHKVDLEAGKPSITLWRVLERGPDWTRLELTPLTGRSHQLRVHLAAIGHAIWGDPLYGSPQSRELAAGLRLHAAELTCTHPASGKRMAFAAACPF